MVGIAAGLWGFLGSGAGNDVINYLFGGNRQILLFFIALAFVVSGLSLIPTLSFSPSTTNVFARKTNEVDRNPYYFFHIAEYESAIAWLNRLGMQVLADQDQREVTLAEQIWIVCRIARRKFFLLRVSASIFLAGWVSSWLPALSHIVLHS